MKKEIPKYHPIPFPVKDSEFEIQASLWSELKSHGLVMRGEVQAVVYDLGKRHKCRLDLVVFNRLMEPIAIVECKNSHEGLCESLAFRTNGRQGRRYSKFGVPVFQCLSMESVQHVSNHIVKLVGENLFG